MNGYWVIFSNAGGELDRAFVKTEEQASDIAREMLDGIPFTAGDSIRVVEGWSENAEQTLGDILPPAVLPSDRKDWKG